MWLEWDASEQYLAILSFFLQWHLLYYVLTCFVTGGISPLPTFATKLSACKVFLQGSVFTSWFMTPLCPIGVECAPPWASSLGGSYLPSWLLMASKGGRTYLLLGSVTHPFYFLHLIHSLYPRNAVDLKCGQQMVKRMDSLLQEHP